MLFSRTYEDLVESNDIAVGAQAFGSTQASLRKSRDTTLQNLWNKMSQQNSWVSSNLEGLLRVKKSGGHFVMFMESATAEYLARKNCEVMLYGDNVFHRVGIHWMGGCTLPPSYPPHPPRLPPPPPSAPHKNL